jgi:uncharacterized protein (TIRG00374 family)
VDEQAPVTVDAPLRPEPRTRRRLHVPRILRHGLTVFILLLVVEYLVIPELVNARKALDAIKHVNVFLLLLALGLEVAAQLAYAKLTMVVLPPRALSGSKVLRINMSALSVSHILPGGTAGGTGLGYRLMTTNGVAGTDVAFAAATQGIGSAIVLNALLWIALIISIPIEVLSGSSHHSSPSLYIEIAAVGTVLLSLAAGLVLAFTRGQAWAIRVLRAVARRLPLVTEEAMERFVTQVSGRLRSLANDRPRLLRATTWALANWLLDAACLWVCLLAFHFVLDPVVLVVAYGVGNVLAAIPATPGGLGIVEGATGFALRGFGVPGAIATLAVLGWRAYNFWLPIPVGAGCYVSLRVERGASVRARRRMLGTMAREAREPIGEEPFEESLLVQPPFEAKPAGDETQPDGSVRKRGLRRGNNGA